MIDLRQSLPWPFSLLIVLWLLALPAAGLWYMTAGPGLLPADVRDAIRPWAIAYIVIVVIATVPLLLLGRRHIPAMREEGRQLAQAKADRAAALAALRPARLTLPARKPGDQDTGPAFHVISRELVVSPERCRYIGYVIASPDYLILVVQEIRSALATSVTSAGGVAGGLVGGLAAGIATSLIGSSKSPLAPLAVPLPETFRKHRDWPLERRSNEPAIILPRAAARNLRASRMSGLQFDLADRHIGVPLPLFSTGKTLANLRQLGWPV